MTGPETGSVVDAADLDAAAAAWTVLSAAFGREPDEQFVDAMRRPDDLAAWPLADERSRAGVALLLRSAEQGETVAQVVADHRRLLRGPERLPVSPYESVHRSVERLVFEPETMQVRAFYRRFGLQAERLNKEPDDHVALESAFLAHLAVRALDVIDAGGDPTHFVDGLRRFVAEHAGVWLPDYFDQVAEHAATDFLRGLAGLGAGAIATARSWV